MIDGARTLAGLSLPLLYIHAADRNFVVTDPAVSLYIGTRSERHQQRARLEVLRFEHPIPCGVLLSRNREDEWEILADGCKEGVLQSADGIGREVASPNFPTGQSRLPEGLSLLILGQEPISLFVPPHAPGILRGGKIVAIRTKQQKELDEELANYRTRAEFAALPANSEEVDRHNAAMRDEFQGRADAPGNLPMTISQGFAFHPATGKVIAYQQDKRAFEWAVIDGFPRARILKNPAGPFFEFPKGEPSQDVKQALLKLHPFYGLK